MEEDKINWVLVDQNIVCKPKGVEGINLEDPKIINKESVEKLWWRWLNRGSVEGAQSMNIL